MSEPLPQLSEAEVKAMTSEQIVAANRAGQLDRYLGITKPSPEEQAATDRIARERAVVHGGITTDDLARMTAEQIVTARREGRLSHLGYAGDRRR